MSTKLSVIWSPCVDFHQGIADAVAILALNELQFMLTDFHLKGYTLILISDIRIETTLQNEGQSSQASQHMPVMPS